ncbi:Mth938-like domain-containing protein [Usitatibacter palustris]|uniref:Mth938-like domain-containing protein n=1 Tax=Usitatibacter palustris TaxID=2732487 RepID=A0A6M4H6Y3_9PROT|nr:Mth938-like domain-containing protein [Usitatibacter palustris]QJR15389.1 hypothetical protein DSM104440_02208 [Usitatibacter palustris]
MKFEQEAADGRNTFTGYGDGYVEVSGQRATRSLVVTGENIVPDWGVASIGALTREQVALIAAMKPEIVLLGSGSAFAFPDPAVLAPLHSARIGVEVMDTKAACRTYNILLGEGRNVLAALVVD